MKSKQSLLARMIACLPILAGASLLATIPGSCGWIAEAFITTPTGDDNSDFDFDAIGDEIEDEFSDEF